MSGGRILTRARSVAARVLAPVGGGALTWAVLALAATVALQVPAVATLAGLPGASPVAYDTSGGLRFAPLSASFIRAVLGIAGPFLSAGSSSDAHPATRSATGDRPTPGAGADRHRVVVDHPFTNDDFRNAYLIPSVPFSGSTDMSTATREPQEPSKCAAVGGTAWYAYRAPVAQWLYANLLSQGPVALDAYTGDSLATLSPAPNSSCSKGSTRNAGVTFPVVAGTTYYFQVTAIARPGRITLTLNAPGPHELASRAADGSPGNSAAGGSLTQGLALSADGRVVAFESSATNLDPQHPLGPCNPATGTTRYLSTSCMQVYVRDRVHHTTQLVSRSSAGASSDAPSIDPSISQDGRYVSFETAGTNLVSGDTNAASDIFVFDRVAGTTTRESLTSAGGQITVVPGNYGSYGARLSPDGRYVGFSSDGLTVAGSAVCNPSTQNCLLLYLRDRLTGAITQVSVDPAGNQVTDESLPFFRTVSEGARYVLFEGLSDQYVPHSQRTCTNPPTAVQGSGCSQVYRRDLVRRQTVLVSAAADGTPANQPTSINSSSMSADGRFASFASYGDNLVPADTNRTIDTFRKDIATGEVIRVSVDSTGAQTTDTGSGAGNAASSTASGSGPRFTWISSDGDLVAFDSAAKELSSSNFSVGVPWPFIHVVSTGATIHLGLATVPQHLAGGGAKRTASSTGATGPVLSADSSTVGYMGQGLVDDDNSGVQQCYVHLLSEL